VRGAVDSVIRGKKEMDKIATKLDAEVVIAQIKPEK
jgi:hypothetical protein